MDPKIGEMQHAIEVERQILKRNKLKQIETNIKGKQIEKNIKGK